MPNDRAHNLLDDFVTGNIYTQKGGLDASIGFETDRGENVGIAFNDALNFFSFFFSQKTSSIYSKMDFISSC